MVNEACTKNSQELLSGGLLLVQLIKKLIFSKTPASGKPENEPCEGECSNPKKSVANHS
jgi:hypothetical protein